MKALRKSVQMKSFIKAVLTLCVLCGLAFAQDKPKVAVYVTGGRTANDNSALSARITHALVSSGRYTTIERSDAFLDQVAREHVRQRSGAIDDRQISALGRQSGADFVCIAEIVEAFGSTQISARIINVVTVQVVASGLAEGQLTSMNDLVELSNRVVGTMLNAASVQTQAASITTFTDPRDGRRYDVKRIGRHLWFLEDLNFNGQSLYFYEELKMRQVGRRQEQYWVAAALPPNRACPPGWRLPGNAEWNRLKADASPQDRMDFTRVTRNCWWNGREVGWTLQNNGEWDTWCNIGMATPAPSLAIRCVSDVRQ